MFIHSVEGCKPGIGREKYQWGCIRQHLPFSLIYQLIIMRRNQRRAIDLLTGLVGDIDDLKVSSKEMSGSFEMLDGLIEGDFEVITNKKGKMKEMELSMGYEFEDDRYARVKVEWEDIKQRKFEKAIRGRYEDTFNDALDLLAQQDIGGFIDELESIPGAGDLSVEGYGNGQNLSFD